MSKPLLIQRLPRRLVLALPVLLALFITLLLPWPRMLSKVGVVKNPTDSLPVRVDWATSSLPPFCKALLSAPLAFNTDCRRGKDMKCIGPGPLEGQYQMFSRHSQDYYVYMNHFRFLRRNGVYLDVAANDPVHNSNSYFFDRCLGWRGVCVEADPLFHEGLYTRRGCEVVPTCVGSIDGQVVSFVVQGQLGAIVGETNIHNKLYREGKLKMGKTIRSRCTTMQRVLDKAGVRHVDFLSLDVEGHELPVLQGIDWNRVRIDVMVVEVSDKTKPKIKKFLSERGYVFHRPTLSARTMNMGALRKDAVYVHKDVVWGSPV